MPTVLRMQFGEHFNSAFRWIFVALRLDAFHLFSPCSTAAASEAINYGGP